MLHFDEKPPLLGRFRIRRRLGGGSMGVVYEALDEASGRRVALKTLHDHRPQYLLQLKREFRAVHAIRHPNLVELGELYESDGRWFFTMQLVEGADYKTWLQATQQSRTHTESEPDLLGSTELVVPNRSSAQRRAGPGCDLVRLRTSLPQLTSALEALHSAGLVHRDVKPSNIVISEDDRLVLMDFGLVRSGLPDAHISSQLAGTVAYMAPEQAGGEAIGSAADYYALGVILYEALTGRLPFVGSTAEVLVQKRTVAPIAPSRLAASVPPDLEELCLRLLAPQPEDRPTASDVIRQLGPLRPSGPILTRHRRFVGRVEEVSRILELFETLENDGPAAVVVHGESGIGKTALLDRTAALMNEVGRGAVLVARGQCFERESVAYAGVDMIMDEIGAYLRRLPTEKAAFVVPRNAKLLCQVFPTLETLDCFGGVPSKPRNLAKHEALTRAQAAFQEFFARLAQGRRIVLIIDDAQWLTEQSRTLLHRLFTTDERLPLLLVLACRTSAATPLSAWLAQQSGLVTDLSLPPLAERESSELLEQYLPAATQEQIATMVSDSGGHPLFLHELARCGDGTSKAASKLDDTIRSRAAKLAPTEAEVLNLVCTAGGPVDGRVIAAALELEPGAFDAVVRNLKAERFLVADRAETTTLLRAFHDRVRSAILEPRLEAEKRNLHRSLALATAAQAPDDVDALALHWDAAGETERGAGAARDAAAKAVRLLAFGRAVELYDRALQGSSWSPAERASICAAKGDALASLGQGSAAASAYLEATSCCSSFEADDLVLRGADQLIRSGRVDDGRQLLERVLDRLGVELPRSQASAFRSLVLGRIALTLRGLSPGSNPKHRTTLQRRRVDACWSAGDLLGLVDPVHSADLHTRGLRFALELGDPSRIARSFASEAWFLASAGPKSEARATDRLRRAERFAGDALTPQLEGWTALCAGVVRLQVGSFGQAQEQFDLAESTFESRCVGAFFEASYAREFALWTLAYRGELQKLSERLPRAVELAIATGNQVSLMRLRCGPSHAAILASNEPHQLLAYCEDGLLGLSRATYPFVHFCTLFARTHANIYLGRAASALALLDAEAGRIRQAQLMRNHFFRVDLAALRGRAALAALAENSAVDGGKYIAVVERSIRELRAEGARWASALASGLDVALSTLDASNVGAAALRLQSAADELAAVGLGLYAAALRYQACTLAGAPALADCLELMEWRDPARVRRPERLAETYGPLPQRPLSLA